jgi:hypothetical protein
MRFVIPFIVAFLLSFTLSGQEYKKVYTEMTEDKFEQILEEENLSYHKGDYGGYYYDHEFENGRSWRFKIDIYTDHIMLWSSLPFVEVDLPVYILNQWNQMNPEIFIYMEEKEDYDALTIKSTVKCNGGVTASHIAYRFRLSGENFTDFIQKYVAK